MKFGLLKSKCQNCRPKYTYPTGRREYKFRSFRALFILQPFRHFTYVTAHSATLPSFYLRHSSFPTLLLLHLRHSSFSNPSFASPTSQALHLRHLASRPWTLQEKQKFYMIFLFNKLLTPLFQLVFFN